MTYKLTTYLDTNAADVQISADTWTGNHDTNKPTEVEDIPPREDGTRVGYQQVTAHLSVQADVEAAVSDLADTFSGAEWCAILQAQTDTEGDTLRADPSYYPPGMTNGLRAPVEVSAIQHTLEYGDVAAVVEGTEVDAQSGTLAVEAPEDSPRTDTLTIETDGSVVLNGSGVELATVEVHPGTIVSVATVDYSLPESDPVQAYTHGTPPAYLADPSVGMPEPLPADYFDRSVLSEQDLEAVAVELDNITDDNTRQALKQIYQIIFDRQP